MRSGWLMKLTRKAGEKHGILRLCGVEMLDGVKHGFWHGFGHGFGHGFWHGF